MEMESPVGAEVPQNPASGATGDASNAGDGNHQQGGNDLAAASSAPATNAGEAAEQPPKIEGMADGPATFQQPHSELGAVAEVALTDNSTPAPNVSQEESAAGAVVAEEVPSPPPPPPKEDPPGLGPVNSEEITQNIAAPVAAAAAVVNETKQEAPVVAASAAMAPSIDPSVVVAAAAVSSDDVVAAAATAAAAASAQQVAQPLPMTNVPQGLVEALAPTGQDQAATADPMPPLSAPPVAVPVAHETSPTIKSPASNIPIGTGPRNTDLPVPSQSDLDLSCFPYQVNLGKDVVSGKGGKVQQVNRHFRNLVAALYHEYDSTPSKIAKRKIGLRIYQEIVDRGGRFLDHDGNAMDQPKAVLKVMKALKDAKTWTSDAKRLAKRRREENVKVDVSKLNAVEVSGDVGGDVKRARKQPPGVLVLPPEPPAPASEAKAEVKEDEGGEGDRGLALLYQAIDGDNKPVQVTDI